MISPLNIRSHCPLGRRYPALQRQRQNQSLFGGKCCFNESQRCSLSFSALWLFTILINSSLEETLDYFVRSGGCEACIKLLEDPSSISPEIGYVALLAMHLLTFGGEQGKCSLVSRMGYKECSWLLFICVEEFRHRMIQSNAVPIILKAMRAWLKHEETLLEAAQVREGICVSSKGCRGRHRSDTSIIYLGLVSLLLFFFYKKGSAPEETKSLCGYVSTFIQNRYIWYIFLLLLLLPL